MFLKLLGIWLAILITFKKLQDFFLIIVSVYKTINSTDAEISQLQFNSINHHMMMSPS